MSFVYFHQEDEIKWFGVGVLLTPKEFNFLEVKIKTTPVISKKYSKKASEETNLDKKPRFSAMAQQLYLKATYVNEAVGISPFMIDRRLAKYTAFPLLLTLRNTAKMADNKIK